MRLLYPSDPLNRTAAAEPYIEELAAARAFGVPCSLFSYVSFVDDPRFAGFTVDQFVAVASGDPNRSFAFIVDHTAITDPEHPILVVDLYDEPGCTFRVIPREMCGVENNLSIANMDFEGFMEAADANGVFRGFPEK